MTAYSDLRLPEYLREELRKPFGEVYQEDELIEFLKENIGGSKIICVGDFVASKLLSHKITPSLIIWDKKTRRIPTDEEVVRVLEDFVALKKTVKNPAGSISKESWSAIEDSLKEGKASILVEGEEDLLVIPSTILAPDDSYVLYGFPDEGIVLIVADSNIKTIFRNLLQEFVEENLQDENRD